MDIPNVAGVHAEVYPEFFGQTSTYIKPTRAPRG